MLDWLFEHRYTATQAGPLAATLAIQADSAVANIVRLAEEMRTGHRLRVAGAPDTSGKLRSAALPSLSKPALRRSPEALRSAIAVASVADWLQQLETLIRDLGAPVAASLTVNSRPLWR